MHHERKFIYWRYGSYAMEHTIRRLERSGSGTDTSILRVFGTLTPVIFGMGNQNTSHRIVNILPPLYVGVKNKEETAYENVDRIPIVDRQNHNSDTALDRQHPIKADSITTSIPRFLGGI